MHIAQCQVDSFTKAVKLQYPSFSFGPLLSLETKFELYSTS